MRFRGLGLVLVLGLVGACGASGASSLPPRASAAPSGASAITPATPSMTPSTAVAGGEQTETEWGRIWDTLPSGFPSYPGAKPSDEAQTGPASAVEVVAGKAVSAVTTWYENALRAASYSTDAAAEPLEDGSHVLEATGTAGCRMELKIAPLGGLTSVTILYGADCPH